MCDDRAEGKPYRRSVDSSFASVLIWPFCTLRGDVELSSDSPSTDPEGPRSVVLVEASIRPDGMGGGCDGENC